MNCDKAGQIQMYFDEELDSAQRAGMAAHLRDCAECRVLLEEIRGLSVLIENASSLSASGDGMRAGAVSRYYGAWHVARERAVLRITGWLTAVAAGLLIGAILTWPGEDQRALPVRAVRSGAWEQFAVMPPAETQAEGGGGQLVQVAQWMANDLSLGGGERR